MAAEPGLRSRGAVCAGGAELIEPAVTREYADLTSSNRRIRTRTYGGVAGISGDRRRYTDQVAVSEMCFWCPEMRFGI